ncbi:hypothetical protein MKZ38_008314 [Zalerion maritima]|uniref:Prefoldin subunit 3 n=1 Tax=Zalerion maritima TaxID=339359 RepID=A0AAD5RH57_9PEZI|nr:hypothetical protein MKZ38_008314 [Zalerion maritima]
MASQTAGKAPSAAGALKGILFFEAASLQLTQAWEIVPEMKMGGQGKETPTNARGIPQAPFVDKVEDYVTSREEVEPTLRSFQEMISKYQFMELNLQRRVTGLKDKMPDIQKTLETVRFLKLRKDAIDPIETTFELNDTLYAKATIPPTDEVFLWLGANVMLSYPIDEAEELLDGKLKAAGLSLSNCEEDLDFLREQITTMEVAVARVYNWDVVQKRKEKEGGAIKSEALYQPSHSEDDKNSRSDLDRFDSSITSFRHYREAIWLGIQLKCAAEQHGSLGLHDEDGSADLIFSVLAAAVSSSSTLNAPGGYYLAPQVVVFSLPQISRANVRVTTHMPMNHNHPKIKGDVKMASFESIPPDLVLCVADIITGRQGDGDERKYTNIEEGSHRSLRTVSHLSRTCRGLYRSLEPYLFEMDGRRHAGPEAALWALLTDNRSLMVRILDAVGDKLYPQFKDSDDPNNPCALPAVRYVDKIMHGAMPGTETPPKYLDIHGRPLRKEGRPSSVYRHHCRLSPGLDRDPKLWRRYSLLHVAAHRGDEDMMSLLLDRGASVDRAGCLTCNCQPVSFSHSCTVGTVPPVHMMDDPAMCYPPLHTAICSGNTGAALLLLERGADVVLERHRSELFPFIRWLSSSTSHVDEDTDLETISPGPYGIMDETALHFACYMGNVELASLILERGFQTDISCPDTHGKTPILYACENGMYERMVRWLASHGADVKTAINSMSAFRREEVLRDGAIDLQALEERK